MINHYEKVPGGNFGDDLNEFLWERIFEKPLEKIGEDDTYFIGIGTRLRRKNIPENKKIIVFGAGYGYETVPPIVNQNWDIRCVRGPLTAEKLQISQDKVITDPVILVALQYPPIKKEYDISFIPHHLSIHEDDWEKVCELSNINYIDSTQHPDFVIQEINKSKLVITESLHGAIIADAFRIPWIPVYTRSHFSKFKWDDWAASMNLKLEYEYLHPLFNKNVRNKSNILKYILRKGYGFILAKKIARKELKNCSKIKPYLSSDEIFNSRLKEMKTCVSSFMEEYG
jgi:succinoglycan biosynthesis protein ExoV